MHLAHLARGVIIPWSVPAGQRGTFAVCLSTARTGPAASAALSRTLRVDGATVPPCELFDRDIRAVWPRGGRAWCVVRYGDTVLSSTPIAL